MKLVVRRQALVLGVLLGSIALFAVPGFGQQKIKKVPPAPTTAIGGADLYKQYCAACHGADGKGAGPAAAALKQAPGDQTQYAKRNSGRFPEDKFMRIMHGEQTVVAHGSQDMPVWGPAFQNMSPDPSMAVSRLHALMDHLERIQAR
jgi:mono/diheme cytochrome c family protein